MPQPTTSQETIFVLCIWLISFLFVVFLCYLVERITKRFPHNRFVKRFNNWLERMEGYPEE